MTGQNTTVNRRLRPTRFESRLDCQKYRTKEFYVATLWVRVYSISVPRDMPDRLIYSRSQRANQTVLVSVLSYNLNAPVSIGSTTAAGATAVCVELTNHERQS
jgi:hypothetical protein